MVVTTAQAQIAISLASVVVAGVLAYVTYQYYTETKQHTAEMRKNREAEFRPVLKGAIVYKPVSYYDFAIINTGKGAAHDVEAEWQVDDYPHTSTWSIPHIAPEKQHNFAVRIEDEKETEGNEGMLHAEQEFRDELADSDGILHYEATCKDALGNTHEFQEDIDIIGAIDGRVAGAMEWQQKDELEQIRRELEDIGDAVEDVESAVEMSGNDSLIRGELTQQVRDIIESRSEVSLQELRKLTGFSRMDLSGVLRRLEEADEVAIDSEVGRLSLRNAEATIRVEGESSN